MAVEIGALRALLSLDSAAFESGAKRAQASMSGIQRATKSAGRAVAKAGKLMAVGLAAGAAAVGVGAVSASKSLSQLAGQARIAGMGAQEFKILSLAAKNFGIEQEKLSDILKDVNDKFGDYFSTGAGPLVDFFENIAPKVGVTKEAFEGLSSSDALQLYVTSLEKANVSQAEMTFYMEALASDATALIPVFKNNGEAIKNMTKRAEELGLQLDEKTIAAAGRARQEFSVVAEVLKTRLAAAFVELIPSITNLIETVMPALTRSMEHVGTVIDALALLLRGEFSAAWNEIQPLVSRVADGVGAALSSLASMGVQAIKDLGRAIVQELSNLVADVVDAAKQLGSDLVEGLKVGIDQRIGALKQSISDAASSVINIFKRKTEVRSPSRVFMRIGGHLMSGLGLGIDKGAQNPVAAAAGAAQQVMNAFDNMVVETGIEDIFSQIGDAAASAIVQGKSFADQMRGVFQQISSDLISSGITQMISGIFGGGRGRGGGVLGGLFAGFFDKGGAIPSGQFGIAGEYGPEIVRGPAQVTSRASTARMLAQQSLHVTVEMLNSGNMQAFVRDQAGQVVAQSAPEIVGASVQATRRQIQNSGSFLGA